MQPTRPRQCASRARVQAFPSPFGHLSKSLGRASLDNDQVPGYVPYRLIDMQFWTLPVAGSRAYPEDLTRLRGSRHGPARGGAQSPRARDQLRVGDGVLAGRHVDDVLEAGAD